VTATTTPAQENRANGTLAIVVAIVVAAIAFALSFSQGWVIWLVILGEITAIALGIMAWHSGAGKLAVVLAVLLTVALIVWVRSPKESGSNSTPPPATAQ
jgi:nicotinamide riboside transporter PnuC